jgi:hypothetical protein
VTSQSAWARWVWIASAVTTRPARFRPLQQRPEPGDLACGVVDLGLGEDRAAGVVHRGQQVHLRAGVMAGAAQGLAVDRDRLPPHRLGC